MWSIVILNNAVRRELDALPLDMRASFERIVELIGTFGLERVRDPYLKHLEGRVWEMRLKGKGGIARALYLVASGRRIVIVRVFIKRSQRTPRREIELALQRAREIP